MIKFLSDPLGFIILRMMEAEERSLFNGLTLEEELNRITPPGMKRKIYNTNSLTEFNYMFLKDHYEECKRKLEQKKEV